MLVLGWLGSGCSIFFCVIVNNRGGYVVVEGEVFYSGIFVKEVVKCYCGEVVYNGEDDQYMFILIVGQIFQFLLFNKIKKYFRDNVDFIIDLLLCMFVI